MYCHDGRQEEVQKGVRCFLSVSKSSGFGGTMPPVHEVIVEEKSVKCVANVFGDVKQVKPAKVLSRFCQSEDM